MCLMALSQHDFPSSATAEWENPRALTMFLEEPVPIAELGSVGGKASWFGLIKDASNFLNLSENDRF